MVSGGSKACCAMAASGPREERAHARRETRVRFYPHGQQGMTEPDRTANTSRYRLKRCKTRRRAVADSHTTDRRCPSRRYDDPIISYRSDVLSYAIRGVEVSSHRPRRSTPRVIYISRRCDAESTAAVKNVVGRGSGQKLSSPAKLVRCNDIATVKLHADNRVILPTSPHVR